MTGNIYMTAMTLAVSALLVGCIGVCAESNDTKKTHGYVGLRPLPRNEADLKANHGGPWAGMPTYDAQKGNYPFVAEHLDVVKGWLERRLQDQASLLRILLGTGQGP
jgi:hypothetical protein